MEEATTSTANISKTKRLYGDPWIWGIYFTLCLISVVIAFSTSISSVSSTSGTYGIYAPVIKHIITMVIGFLVLFIVQSVPYYNRWFRISIVVFAVIAAISMVLVLFVGDTINSAKRSFSIFGISIQPPEFAKLATVLFVALVVSRFQERGGVKLLGVILSGGMVAISGGLSMSQGLTNTAIIVGSGLALMFIGGTQLKRLAIVMGAYALVGWLGLTVASAFTKSDDKKDPSTEQLSALPPAASPSAQYAAADAVMTIDLSRHVTTASMLAAGQGGEEVKGEDDRNATRVNRLKNYEFWEHKCLERRVTPNFYQEQYSYMARANGGLIGVFPGNSRESSRLVHSNSDYIYSIIIEELGLLGGLFVLLLYLSMLARAGRTFSQCTRAFPALLVLGSAVLITLQALAHITINCGLVPISGQPLPIISYGGSSMLVMSAAFGVIINVSRYATEKAKDGTLLTGTEEENIGQSRVLEAENPIQAE